MLGHEPVTLALERVEQDFQYFKGSLSYIMSSELAGGKRKRREKEEDRKGGAREDGNRKEGEGGSGREK